MKKLFLIVAAMFAAVSFSACSDDDDNGHVSDKPVLVKQCIITEEYGETDIVYFEYDSQNRISHISSAERTDGKEEFLFSYNENKMTITYNKLIIPSLTVLIPKSIYVNRTQMAILKKKQTLIMIILPILIKMGTCKINNPVTPTNNIHIIGIMEILYLIAQLENGPQLLLTHKVLQLQ